LTRGVHQRRLRRCPVRYKRVRREGELRDHYRGRVRRWLRSGRFDLLHVHEPVTPSIALLALWAAEQPVVGTFHAATPRSRSLRLAGTMLRAAVDKLDARIAVSETARQVVRRHLGTDAAVVPNGIHFADFAGPSPVPAGRRRPRLLFLGRTDEPRKGLDVLLDALPAMRRAEPDLEVVIAGEGHQSLRRDAAGSADQRDGEGRAAAAARTSSSPRNAPGRASASSRGGHGQRRSGRRLRPRPVRGPARSAAGTRGGPVFAAGDPAALARAVVDELRRPDPARTRRGPAAGPALRLVGRRAEIEQVYRTVLTTGPGGPRPAAGG
jgi:phosphatidylinositol alpha-mannosyltransferase